METKVGEAPLPFLNNGCKAIAVFLADAHGEVRAALHLLLEQSLPARIIGQTNTANNLVDEIRTTRPDIVLLDWGIPGPPLVRVIASLRNLDHPVKVIILSSCLEVSAAALAVGADAFVSKIDSPQRLLTKMRLVLLEDQTKTFLYASDLRVNEDASHCYDLR